MAESRTAPVPAVLGAAGTGKSHTVSAIACDAVALGETVLVAANTDAAAKPCWPCSARRPGSSRSSSAPASAGPSWPGLSAGELRPAAREPLEEARRSLEEAVGARERLTGTINGRLQAEADLDQTQGRSTGRGLVVPSLFDPSAGLAELRHLLTPTW